MKASQLWSSLPAVIEEYDPTTCKATVKCMIKMRYIDGSQIAFPPIYNVSVITPATAFAGMRLPVRVGDKVVLHIQDRDIQLLLFDNTTAGLDEIDKVKCETARQHDLTDCIAYTGFGSFDSVKPSDFDVWIFNNDDDDNYNHVRFKQNGDIELKTFLATATLEQGGDIELKNTTCSLKMTELGNVSFNNTIASTNMDPTGNITTTNGTTTVNQTIAGAVTITAVATVNVVAPVTNVTSPSVNVTAATAVTMTTPLLNVTGAITAVGPITSLSLMTAPAVGGALVHPS